MCYMVSFQLDETNVEHDGSGEMANQHKPVRKCVEVKVRIIIMYGVPITSDVFCYDNV